MTGVKQFPTRRASRGAVILIAAATLAGALVALPGLVAPDRASAAQRIAWGGTSAWDWKWETTSFSLPGAGVIDIWTTCRPRSTDVRH